MPLIEGMTSATADSHSLQAACSGKYKPRCGGRDPFHHLWNRLNRHPDEMSRPRTATPASWS
jgi:hypothetical protein